jgi:hypothetical protein
VLTVKLASFPASHDSWLVAMKRLKLPALIWLARSASQASWLATTELLKFPGCITASVTAVGHDLTVQLDAVKLEAVGLLFVDCSEVVVLLVQAVVFGLVQLKVQDGVLPLLVVLGLNPWFAYIGTGFVGAWMGA